MIEPRLCSGQAVDLTVHGVLVNSALSYVGAFEDFVEVGHKHAVCARNVLAVPIEARAIVGILPSLAV